MNSLHPTPQNPPLGGGGSAQTSNTLLMIEPVAFGYNNQTAVNNYFQQKVNLTDADIQQKALTEFQGMVGLLRANGINVLEVKDTVEPYTPDSIFLNNWVSFYEGGQVVLYPMFALNRRHERRKDILEFLEEKGAVINNLVDFTFWEEQNLFLEGTGSMIFDRIHKIAYAALSQRTNKGLFLQFCSAFDFKPVCFSANQSVKGKRLPIYHTNVMMTVADPYAVVCLDAIDDADEYSAVVDALKKTGKDIIPISERQMNCFAGNMLQVENNEGTRFLVLSRNAYESLSRQQLDQLTSYNQLIVVPIPTIERVGGGSVRCMMAEVF